MKLYFEATVLPQILEKMKQNNLKETFSNNGVEFEFKGCGVLKELFLGRKYPLKTIHKLKIKIENDRLILDFSILPFSLFFLLTILYAGIGFIYIYDFKQGLLAPLLVLIALVFIYFVTLLWKKASIRAELMDLKG